MVKKYGKEILYSYSKFLDEEHFEVLICRAKSKKGEEGYFDVHVVSERFRDDESNTLKLQVPESYITNPDAYFTRAYMIGVLMEHFIWDRFYGEGIFEGSIECSFISHEEVT